VASAGLHVSGGQLWCQRYWSQIQDLILQKRIDPLFVITHVSDLASATTI
jgi:threonine dehydrogenase-like Zn-dependent dehydrogenase